jgi:hypothetical protein
MTLSLASIAGRRKVGARSNGFAFGRQILFHVVVMIALLQGRADWSAKYPG